MQVISRHLCKGPRAAGQLLPPHCLMSPSARHAEHVPPLCPQIAHRCLSYAFLTQNAGDIPPSMQGARAAGCLLPPHCLMSPSARHDEHAPPPCPRITHRCLLYAFLTQNAGDIPPSMQGALRDWLSPASSSPQGPERTPYAACMPHFNSNRLSMLAFAILIDT
jgi:hypothetical protein